MAGFAAAEPLTATDLLRLRDVRTIDISSDGDSIVFSVSSYGAELPAAIASFDLDEVGSRRTRRVASNTCFLPSVCFARAGDESALPTTQTRPDVAVRQLTFGDRRDRSPIISPDGSVVAFLRAGGTDRTWFAPVELSESRTIPEKAAQVWILPLAGGEARQVTWFPRGCGAPKWSPDGRRLIVSVQMPLDEIPDAASWPLPTTAPERARNAAGERRTASDPGGIDTPGGAPDGAPDGTRAEVHAWLDGRGDESNPRVIDRLNFLSETGLRDAMTVSQLVVVDLHGGEVPTASRVSRAATHDREGVFLPSGTGIVFTRTDAGTEHLDRAPGSGLWTSDVDGRNARELVDGAEWNVSEPRPGADGSMIAFRAEQTDNPAFRQMRLGLVAVAAGGSGDVDREAGGDPVWLTETETFDYSVRSLRWQPGGTSVMFGAAVEGGFPLYSMGLGLLEPTPVVNERDGLPIGVHAFDVGPDAVVYTETTPLHPCRLRLRTASRDDVIFDLNPWTADVDLSTPVAGEVQRPDGKTIDYWVMEPTRQNGTSRAPLVVEVHGGPSAMWGPGERSMWHEFQLLCNWGFGVVYCNPRGSGGYGEAFQRGNERNWGDGPAGDVLACVDAATQLSWVDADRLCLTGGSYGGYLTAWIIAHDQRFKAAVAQRGVYDLRTFYGEGNAWRLLEWAMGGKPWEAKMEPILRRESPITYVTRIKTPLLIMHGDVDMRTGVSQSAMLYRMLKDLGRPVEYVRYPDASHDLSRSGEPLQRIDRLLRIIEFFERSIDNPRIAPTR